MICAIIDGANGSFNLDGWRECQLGSWMAITCISDSQDTQHIPYYCRDTRYTWVFIPLIRYRYVNKESTSKYFTIDYLSIHSFIAGDAPRLAYSHCVETPPLHNVNQMEALDTMFNLLSIKPKGHLSTWSR